MLLSTNDLQSFHESVTVLESARIVSPLGFLQVERKMIPVNRYVCSPDHPFQHAPIGLNVVGCCPTIHVSTFVVIDGLMSVPVTQAFVGTEFIGIELGSYRYIFLDFCLESVTAAVRYYLGPERPVLSKIPKTMTLLSLWRAWYRLCAFMRANLPPTNVSSACTSPFNFLR